MKIAVYTDYKHNNDVLCTRLAEGASDAYIKTIDADDILSDQLKEYEVLVMPGGADLYYCEKLNGAANAKIRQFVDSGGKYLGICAGAYYGASQLRWASDRLKDAICGTRELAFVQGNAVGPIDEYMEGNFEQSWDGVCQLDTPGGIVYAIYRGGCYFKALDGADILATYADLPNQPPAIIGQRVGDGYALLSGPHIEMRGTDYARTLYKHRNNSYNYERRVADQMSPYDPENDSYWKKLLNELIEK